MQGTTRLRLFDEQRPMKIQSADRAVQMQIGFYLRRVLAF